MHDVGGNASYWCWTDKEAKDVDWYDPDLDWCPLEKNMVSTSNFNFSSNFTFSSNFNGFVSSQIQNSEITMLTLNQVLTIEPGCYFNETLLDPALADEVQSQFINGPAIEPFRGIGGVNIIWQEKFQLQSLLVLVT